LLRRLSTKTKPEVNIEMRENDLIGFFSKTMYSCSSCQSWRSSSAQALLALMTRTNNSHFEETGYILRYKRITC
jgi:hypothetical protein